MTSHDDAPYTRWPFSRFLKISLILAAIGYLPLELYIRFGPSDGNPVGLGLLFVVGLFAGFAVLVVGLITYAIQYFRER